MEFTSKTWKYVSVHLTSNFVCFFQPEFKEAVKRTAGLIFDRGGFIRKIDYLGFNPLPYKISKNRLPYRHAEQIIFKCDFSAKLKNDLVEETDLDVDIIRCRVYPLQTPKPIVCNLQEDLIPVAYRRDVKKLVELQQKKKKVHWAMQTGIPYYPYE